MGRAAACDPCAAAGTGRRAAPQGHPDLPCGGHLPAPGASAREPTTGPACHALTTAGPGLPFCRGLAPVRLRGVGGGSEGTPGNPSSARATRVPEVPHPVVRSGSCGRLTGHPLRPPRVRGRPAVPITVTIPMRHLLAGTWPCRPLIGRGRHGVGDGRCHRAAAGNAGRLEGMYRGPPAGLERTPGQSIARSRVARAVGAPPGRRLGEGPGASPPTPAATTHPANPSPHQAVRPQKQATDRPRHEGARGTALPATTPPQTNHCQCPPA